MSADRSEAVVREVLLLASSCEDYLLARSAHSIERTAESFNDMETARTRYGHHLMVLLGDDATDEEIVRLDLLARDMAYDYVHGAETEEHVEDYIDGALYVLRRSVE